MIEKELTKLKKKVAKNDPEMKEMVTTSNNVIGLYTGSNSCTSGSYQFTNMIYNNALSIIPQGSDYNQRVGREVKPQYIELSIVLNGMSAVGLDHPYRLIVYQDRGYDGSNLPALNWLVSSPSGAAGDYQTFMGDYNPDYVAHKGDRKNRFKILVDKRGFVSPRIQTTTAVATTGNNNRNSSQFINIRKKLKGADIINYSGTGQATHVAGSIFYFLTLGNGATTAENCSAQIRTRLLYTDT